MFALYQFIVGLLFWTSFPFLLAIVLITGRHRRGLTERLGFYDPQSCDAKNSGRKRIWIHAASIGEVRAAKILIDRLQPDLHRWDFLVSTMTIHGRDFAREHLGAQAACYLAPLDVSFAVGRALSFFSADIYVCLETELWPLLLGRLKRTGVPAVLINGRLSDKSIPRYRRFSFLFASALQSFESIGAITGEDRRRFIEVGADPERVVVTGNIKHDVELSEDRQEINRKWLDILSIEANTDVFIAGSTHNPEEQLLLPLITKLISEGQIALLAPRHLKRLDSLKSLLAEHNLDYELLSVLKQGQSRQHPLIVVDTFGDLGELYSIATFVFVGGSLSGYGGHNVMEPAVWGRVVFFGPDMDDFKESAELLENCGGGYKVEAVAEIDQLIAALKTDTQRLQDVQRRARQAAEQQQGAADNQAALILRSLEKTITLETLYKK